MKIHSASDAWREDGEVVLTGRAEVIYNGELLGGNMENLQKSFSGGRLLSERAVSGLRLTDGIYFANTNVPKHSHDYAVFCIALKGACREFFAGRVRHYEALSVQYLPTYQCHTLDFSLTDMRAFSIDVTRKWLERADEYSLKIENSIHCHGGLLSGLMMKLYREFRVLDNASPLAIEGLTLELLAEVSRHTQSAQEKHAPQWLERAVEMLRERFAERLTITEVAMSVGVHPVHLSREFSTIQTMHHWRVRSPIAH